MLQSSRNIHEGNMNKKIFVANLPYPATEPELNALFSKAGSVMPVKIDQDSRPAERGIAFVEISTQWEG
jgi:RNA recognition motif-containing protein